MKRPSVPGRGAMHRLSPKRRSDVGVKGRGSADEAIVVVKPKADENAVTYLRIKLLESSRNAGGEGGTRKRKVANIINRRREINHAEPSYR